MNLDNEVKIFREMETLQHIVDKTVHFYHKTLFTAKLAGPFSDTQLQSMFAEAHFCAELTSLPPVYGRVVTELQERYSLLLAPKMLLTSLADNLRVNRQSLDRARELFDKQV